MGRKWSDGGNRLPAEEVERIREVYKQCRSIYKTATFTGHARPVVNKYVRDMSRQDSRSRYNNREVLKLEPETGKVIRRYKNANTAAVRNHIRADNICHCLKGRTKTAGGYVWSYADIYDPERYTSITDYHVSYIRQEDILLGLD